jgi:poly-gamma-glutamate synthesis protein (capsule biosynthesis protein)
MALFALCAGILSGAEPQKQPGFYRDTVGDLESDPAWFYPWYLYKEIHPVRHAPPAIEDYFKNQDLDFGKPDASGQIKSRVKIAAVGDIMAKTGINSRNAAHLLDEVSPYLQQADIAFGNLESPAVPGKPTSVFPKYNYDSALVGMFKHAGFDVFATANNHSLDQGPEGLAKTLDYLDQIGIYHVGTARSEQERDRNLPVLEKNGLKTAFLAYTFSTNGRKIPPDKPWMVNRVNFNLIKEEPDLALVEKDIQSARQKGAEIVIVSAHWGMEYEFYPPARIIERGHQIIEMGADIILGHHSHCLEPMERYLPKNQDRRGLSEALIVYSLGNFIPDHAALEFKTSAMLGIELARGTLEGRDRIWIERLELAPIFFYSRLAPSPRLEIIRTDHALNPANAQAYVFLNPKNFSQLRQAQDLVEQIMVPPGKSLKDFSPSH